MIPASQLLAALDRGGVATFTVTADLDSWLPAGNYLINVTEFGVTLAYREHPHQTWSPPTHGKDVT